MAPSLLSKMGDEWGSPTSKGLIFFREMLWKELKKKDLVVSPYVIRYKIDLAWFLLPIGKRRVYEVEAALITDPESPVLNPLFYQQEDSQYLTFLEAQALIVPNPHEIFSELGYDPALGFEYERKKSVPSNQANSSQDAFEKPNKRDQSERPIHDSAFEQPSMMRGDDSWPRSRQGGFLYFIESCRLNFSVLGGNVLKFNDDCWNAWAALPDTVKDQFQYAAVLEAEALRPKGGVTACSGPSSAIGLNFPAKNYQTFMKNGGLEAQAGGQAVRRQKRGDPQTSKRRKTVNPTRSPRGYSLNESTRSRSIGRPRKNPNAPKRPISSYLYFVSEYRHILRRMHPHLSFATISRILGIQWKEMTGEEKESFEQKATLDRARYGREMLQFNTEQFNQEEDTSSISSNTNERNSPMQLL